MVQQAVEGWGVTSNRGSMWLQVPDEVPQPEILRYCKRCHKRLYISGDGREFFGVVSPVGVAHVGADGGDTLCGRDATGDKWWWRL